VEGCGGFFKNFYREKIKIKKDMKKNIYFIVNKKKYIQRPPPSTSFNILALNGVILT